jgi:aminopeptidase N
VLLVGGFIGRFAACADGIVFGHGALRIEVSGNHDANPMLIDSTGPLVRWNAKFYPQRNHPAPDLSMIGRRILIAAQLALLTASALTAQAAPPLEAGVTLELARHRAATLANVAYTLSLDVTGQDTATGVVLIQFDRAADAGDLVLDFRGPRLGRITANGRAVADTTWRSGHIRVPARHLRTGRNAVQAVFAARIAAAGAPILRVDDPRDRTSYLYTLLVPSDAQALFPSFDQPDLKARVRTRITAPRGWSVLANGALEGHAPAGRGEEWRFAQTEPISTYLIAFAAGPWSTWSAPAGTRPLTLYARQSRRAEVDADTLIATNLRAAAWLERFFGLPFPFAKMDALLAPAFPFGGMEHVGAIFYNESQFVFREPPTLNQRLGRNATIYHEVAHQWFGDLVTMRWFDDLWLKEGFSTYMAARMQDELEPGSGAWRTFYLRNKPLAYATDATRGTTPVWQALPNLELAKSNYGPIVYNKAPSILKQLNYLVGDSAFRAGVRLFLTRHAYGNATWRDLLAAVEEASGTSLRQFGEQYILRAGLPVVHTVMETENGAIRSLRLVQRPVRPLPGDPGGWWPGRVQLRLGYSDREDVLLPVAFAGDTTVVAAAAGLPAPDYVWSNDGDYGYGLFLLDQRSAEHVLAHVGEERDELLRALLWGALWDQVREGLLPAERFAEAAMRSLPGERDEQIADFILGRASTALTYYLLADAQNRLAARWEELLLARAVDPGLSYGMRKSSLDAFVSSARTEAGRAALRDFLAGRRQFDGGPVKQPTRWGIVTTLAALGEPSPDAMIAAEAARDTTAESPRRAFTAGAAIPTVEARAAYFRRYLEDRQLNEEWVTASVGSFNDPARPELSLPYLRPSLDRLEWIRDNRRIFFLPRWVNAFIGGQTSPEALAVVDRFLAENPRLPEDIRRKVLQARDELERTITVRGRR